MDEDGKMCLERWEKLNEEERKDAVRSANKCRQSALRNEEIPATIPTHVQNDQIQTRQRQTTRANSEVWLNTSRAEPHSREVARLRDQDQAEKCGRDVERAEPQCMMPDRSQVEHPTGELNNGTRGRAEQFGVPDGETVPDGRPCSIQYTQQITQSGTIQPVCARYDKVPYYNTLDQVLTYNHTGTKPETDVEGETSDQRVDESQSEPDVEGEMSGRPACQPASQQASLEAGITAADACLSARETKPDICQEERRATEQISGTGGQAEQTGVPDGEPVPDGRQSSIQYTLQITQSGTIQPVCARYEKVPYNTNIDQVLTTKYIGTMPETDVEGEMSGLMTGPSNTPVRTKTDVYGGLSDQIASTMQCAEMVEASDGDGEMSDWNGKAAVVYGETSGQDADVTEMCPAAKGEMSGQATCVPQTIGANGDGGISDWTCRTAAVDGGTSSQVERITKMCADANGEMSVQATIFGEKSDWICKAEDVDGGTSGQAVGVTKMCADANGEMNGQATMFEGMSDWTCKAAVDGDMSGKTAGVTKKCEDANVETSGQDTVCSAANDWNCKASFVDGETSGQAAEVTKMCADANGEMSDQAKVFGGMSHRTIRTSAVDGEMGGQDAVIINMCADVNGETSGQATVFNGQTTGVTEMCAAANGEMSGQAVSVPQLVKPNSDGEMSDQNACVPQIMEVDSCGRVSEWTNQAEVVDGEKSDQATSAPQMRSDVNGEMSGQVASIPQTVKTNSDGGLSGWNDRAPVVNGETSDLIEGVSELGTFTNGEMSVRAACVLQTMKTNIDGGMSEWTDLAASDSDVRKSYMNSADIDGEMGGWDAGVRSLTNDGQLICKKVREPKNCAYGDQMMSVQTKVAGGGVDKWECAPLVNRGELCDRVASVTSIQAGGGATSVPMRNVQTKVAGGGVDKWEGAPLVNRVEVSGRVASVRSPLVKKGEGGGQILSTLEEEKGAPLVNRVEVSGRVASVRSPLVKKGEGGGQILSTLEEEKFSNKFSKKSKRGGGGSYAESNQGCVEDCESGQKSKASQIVVGRPIVDGGDYACGEEIVDRNCERKTRYEKKEIHQEITRDNDGRFKLRKVVDFGLEVSTKKRIVGNSIRRQSLRENLVYTDVENCGKEMTVGRKLIFGNVRPVVRNSEDALSTILRREIILEDLNSHKLVGQKIRLFEQGREEADGRHGASRRTKEAAARSEKKLLEIQKTPLKSKKKKEEKMTPTSWKKVRRRSSAQTGFEAKANTGGGGVRGKSDGSLRLGVASARRKFENLERFGREDLVTGRKGILKKVIEVTSPLPGTQVSSLNSGNKITCLQASSSFKGYPVPRSTSVQGVQAPARQLGGEGGCTGDSSTSSMGHSLAR